MERDKFAHIPLGDIQRMSGCLDQSPHQLDQTGGDNRDSVWMLQCGSRRSLIRYGEPCPNINVSPVKIE